MSKKHQPPATQRVKAGRVPNEQLKAHWLEKNWTQVYVATRIGANDVEVSRWETGAAEPSLYFRERLCELFGVSPEALGFVSPSKTGQGEAMQHLLQRRDPRASLLATKLYVPRPRPCLVPRPHLIERLQYGGRVRSPSFRHQPGLAKPPCLLSGSPRRASLSPGSRWNRKTTMPRAFSPT